jgi:hypothetical protein
MVDIAITFWAIAYILQMHNFKQNSKITLSEMFQNLTQNEMNLKLLKRFM